VDGTGRALAAPGRHMVWTAGGHARSVIVRNVSLTILRAGGQWMRRKCSARRSLQD